MESVFETPKLPPISGPFSVQVHIGAFSLNERARISSFRSFVSDCPSVKGILLSARLVIRLGLGGLNERLNG